ncbi:hypothetical protein pb186bvf_020472 [Paramecium bursaria]
MDQNILNQALFVATKDQIQDNLYITLGQQVYYQLQKLLNQGEINELQFYQIIENSKSNKLTQQSLGDILLGKIKYTSKNIQQTGQLKKVVKEQTLKDVSKKFQRILPKLSYDRKPTLSKNPKSPLQSKRNYNQSYYTCYKCNKQFIYLDQLTEHRQNCR